MKNKFNNRVVNMDKEGYKLIKKHNYNKKNILYVEIDGNKIQSWKEYIVEMEKYFKFPTDCTDNIDGYLDWMRDLSWLKKDGYFLVINNFNEFIKNNIELKNKIVLLFREVILPFWEEEVENVVVEGKSKSFVLILVN